MTPKRSNRQLVLGFGSFCKGDGWRYTLSFFLMLLTLAFDLARPFILKDALDHVEHGNLEAMTSAAMVFLSLVVLEYVSRSGYDYVLSIAFLRTINRIRSGVYRHVLRLKMAFFDREPVGRLLTRTINDAESLGETLRAGIATVVVDVLTVIGVFWVMARLDLRMTPVMLVSVPALFFLVRWCGRQLRAKYLEIRKALAKSNGFMAEGINGVEILQLFQQQPASAKKYESINREYRQATIWSNVFDASLYASVDGLAALTTAAVVYWGYAQILGPVEISVLIVYINLIERIFVPIRDLSSKFTVIQQALAALQRIFELLDADHRIPQGAQTVTGRQLDVVFSDVDFAYGDDAPRVLKEISFTVEPSQVVALVGKTGSGKSTIGKLLTRAYDGYSGDIRVGGVELREANLDSLRSAIGVVHQDFEVFPGSLRENIAMYQPGITDEKIVQAIRWVKASHLLEKLEGGLDFLIKENGSNLSLGQLQLIVFARALVSETPIILMDEATSSVDSLTEAWIQQALEQIFAAKTVIVVAHRLSTIAAADQILVLNEGRIIQRGTHSELLELQDGYYAELVRAAQEATHIDGDQPATD